ncbi:VCBS repeat-containing protein [Streptomyces sp. NPDC091278]|uniref:FG-GAP repeat domain-containing protein n=1 Tax=Streptomyces sp. NPDC091278 TaxID=3155301 RepID=UPI00344CD0BA
MLATDKSGILWLYPGTGRATAPFAARERGGAGWGGFTDLVGVGDANGDGRVDLIAAAGNATFYAGTGNWKAPFKPGAKTNAAASLAYDELFQGLSVSVRACPGLFRRLPGAGDCCRVGGEPGPANVPVQIGSSHPGSSSVPSHTR